MEYTHANPQQVLALKYRPKRFENLVGQDSISTTLSLALDTNRLSHAYLLSGLRGSGKTSTARIMAKGLVCQNAPTSHPCESCQSCQSANENKHLDIIEMDAASNRGIDDIKSLIEHTKYKPTSALYKVFIIDEVHMLTPPAFNALLKTLEEPPSFVKFILATTDPLKLPATILSRTQHFRFKKISDKNILHHLSHILNKENIRFESNALEMLTRAGQGSLRDTLTLLDQAIIYSKGIITSSSVTEMLGMIDPLFMDNLFTIILQKQDIRSSIESLENYEAGQVLDEMSIYLKQKMLLNDTRFSLDIFEKFFRIIANSKQLLYMNSDNGFVLIITLSQMIEAIHTPVAIANTPVVPHVEKRANQSPIEPPKENPVQQTPIKESSPKNPQFEALTQKVFAQSTALGNCFEKSFTFASYERNVLKINSTAQGECKALLYKNFAHIKMIVAEIYGIETELDFEKIQKNPEKELGRKIETSIDQPSSCMESMTAIQNPNLSQKDLNIDDVLNSKMTTTLLKLFQSPNPPRIKSKL